MVGVTVDFSNTEKFIKEEELEKISLEVKENYKKIVEKNGEGSEMLGWLDYASKMTEEEIKKIQNAARKIQSQSEVLVVVGIGGSYLGARAVIELMTDPFYNLKGVEYRKTPKIVYAGNNMSAKYMRSLLEFLEDKDFSINVISKSGKTLEPAVSFRMLKEYMEEKYGISGAAERIYITTDSEKGVLKQIANKNSYETFVVPDDVGGRYSVLTPVGLLPIAVAGIDIVELLEGASFAEKVYANDDINNNDAYKYAAIRNILNRNGKDIEIMSAYEPSMHYFTEWFKQLYGESEGKDGKAIFPVGVDFTTDLHSLGQIIQEGKRNVFETVLEVSNTGEDLSVVHSDEDYDGLEYLAGTELDWLNQKAMQGTISAHVSGNVPCIKINLREIKEYHVGQLIYFFEIACAMSAYILGVNPFNQPGVEAYKNNMMELINEKKNID